MDSPLSFIDSNILFKMRRDERLPSVILSEAKDLAPGNEILRFAQDDKLVFSILTALARTRTSVLLSLKPDDRPWRDF